MNSLPEFNITEPAFVFKLFTLIMLFPGSPSIECRSSSPESVLGHRNSSFSSSSGDSVYPRNTSRFQRSSLPTERTISVTREEPELQTKAVTNALDTAQLLDQTTISTAAGPEEEELSEDILQLLGQRILPERVPAQATHKDLVVRIEEILKKGLPREEKQQLLRKFPPPSNCLIIDPPKLNLEIKACLQEAVAKRDSRIVEKQAGITAGISGLISLLPIVLKYNINEKLSMVETLSGIIRLLSDLLRDESLIRRSLIMKNINVSLRDTCFNGTG